MEKRYQVFVSSTYSDLELERKLILESLSKMDCIPAGMEYFPASSAEQFEFIKRIIDDSDYYILIIAGRYGSELDDGTSYTEKEYEYAKSKGIPILAFIHGDKDAISSGKTDISLEKINKLESFKREISSKMLVNYWTSKEDLCNKVVLSLIDAFKRYQRIGWIRGDQTNNESLLQQLNDIRLHNAALTRELIELRGKALPIIADLASGNESFDLFGVCCYNSNYNYENWCLTLTIDQISSKLMPLIYISTPIMTVKEKFEGMLKSSLDKDSYDMFELDEDIFQTIKVHFEAQGYIKSLCDNTSYKSPVEVLQITEEGKMHLYHIKTIKKNDFIPFSEFCDFEST